MSEIPAGVLHRAAVIKCSDRRYRLQPGMLWACHLPDKLASARGNSRDCRSSPPTYHRVRASRDALTSRTHLRAPGDVSSLLRVVVHVGTLNNRNRTTCVDSSTFTVMVRRVKDFLAPPGPIGCRVALRQPSVLICIALTVASSTSVIPLPSILAGRCTPSCSSAGRRSPAPRRRNHRERHLPCDFVPSQNMFERANTASGFVTFSSPERQHYRRCYCPSTRATWRSSLLRHQGLLLIREKANRNTRASSGSGNRQWHKEPRRQFVHVLFTHNHPFIEDGISKASDSAAACNRPRQSSGRSWDGMPLRQHVVPSLAVCCCCHSSL